MECSCEQCVEACSNYPGWPTSEEAARLIDQGFGDRLMVDYFFREDDDVPVLIPKTESGSIELFGNNVCTFLSHGRCELHGTNLKPRQCRETFCCIDSGPDKFEMQDWWDNAEAQALVKWWKEHYT